MRSLLAIAAIVTLAGAAPLQYPAAPQGDVTDTYFGTTVPDPYRWMENIDSPQTRAWVQAEAALTNRYFSQIPQRARILAELKRTANYERFSVPYHERDQYFYTYNSGLQNQSVLYTMNGAHGTARVLINPNTLSTDGTVALGPSAVTLDGKLIAYSTQSAGSDWQTWHVRDVVSGKDLSDTLQWSKFSNASWRKDDSGFYYDRYDAPAPGQTYKAALYGQKVYFHRLGTPESADTLIYQDPRHKDYFFDASVTEDGRYVVLTQSGGRTYNTRLYYEDLRSPNPRFQPLLVKNDAQWQFVDNDGPVFFIETDKDAPNHKIVALNVEQGGAPRTLVPEWSSAVDSVNTAGRSIFVLYLKDAHTAVRQYTYAGRLVREVSLPGIGTATGFSGEPGDHSTYYSFSGYTTPPRTYAFDISSGTSSIYRAARVSFDNSQYVTDEVFYRSKDGTRVPMMIAHRKGLRLDGTNPTILYAYGGFDIPISPAFSPNIATWLKMGGVYAVANIRGGSEYGEAWHHAGMLTHKQRVFDDFIAAAQYLIAQKYTSTPKLGISGASNGGLLIGAAETQRPDLFGAALPSVGVMDMLRFQDFTIGNSWISEYGCSTCNAAQFKALYAYSPYHNIKPGVKYPPTLISTADHDDRVFPAHSFKFAARMQHDQAGDAPVLLRVDSRSGHGGGKPITKVLDDYADAYAFLLRNLHLTLPPAF
jgi:prolyl oligopeptidase